MLVVQYNWLFRQMSLLILVIIWAKSPFSQIQVIITDFGVVKESRNNSGSVSNDVWRLLTSSFANQAYWTQTGTNLYYVGGNVGIGTKTPLSKLSIADVSGSIRCQIHAGLAIGNIYANTHSADRWRDDR